MEDPIEELRKNLIESLKNKTSDWREKVYSSQQYRQEIKYINDITLDFVNTLRMISVYSTRGGEIYKKFLCIRASDDIIQSAIAIDMLIQNGIHNTVKSELRYLIEMVSKYVIVDYAKMGETLEVKTQYLKEEIPSSSIEVIEGYSTPFIEPVASIFRSDIKDFFYKACAYVHPSKKQIEEQLSNFERGNTIGFESAKMITDVNKTVFRAYDMILTMIFHGFGYSMSKDLFEQLYNDDSKWKYHKGKYVKEYSKTLFN
jgi:hypothetical protein